VSGTPALKKRFGDRVRELRHAAGLSQADVASALGITVRGYAHLEAGRRLSVPQLEPIADVLGVQVRDLFDFDRVPAKITDADRVAALLRTATPSQRALVERVVRAILNK
jgi:transcriptional regulator with XRE-family HTH domain